MLAGFFKPNCGHDENDFIELLKHAFVGSISIESQFWSTKPDRKAPMYLLCLYLGREKCSEINLMLGFDTFGKAQRNSSPT